MKRHYAGLSARMVSEITSISERMSHAGERGRNNELVLREFLEDNLAQRYFVSTGKVVSVGGGESNQMDLIVHDRLDTPALVEAKAWSLVPIESVFAAISVKTSLDKGELRDAIASIQSVRRLPQRAAIAIQANGNALSIPEANLLRPRGFVFGFRSQWATPEAADTAFRELLQEVNDELRPNAVCILNQCFIVRRPFTTETVMFRDHALMHFFIFLSYNIANIHKYSVNLRAYFDEDYGG